MSDELVQLYILDIHKEIEDIKHFTEGFDLQMFLDDSKNTESRGDEFSEYRRNSETAAV